VEAAQHFLAGSVDPRVLVSYFPELSRPLFTDGEEAEVYDGIAKRMPSEANVDDLSEYLVFINAPPRPLQPCTIPLHDTPASDSPTPLPRLGGTDSCREPSQELLSSSPTFHSRCACCPRNSQDSSRRGDCDDQVCSSGLQGKGKTGTAGGHYAIS
jgi:hypothetical protein